MPWEFMGRNGFVWCEPGRRRAIAGKRGANKFTPARSQGKVSDAGIEQPLDVVWSADVANKSHHFPESSHATGWRGDSSVEKGESLPIRPAFTGNHAAVIRNPGAVPMISRTRFPCFPGRVRKAGSGHAAGDQPLGQPDEGLRHRPVAGRSRLRMRQACADADRCPPRHGTPYRALRKTVTPRARRACTGAGYGRASDRGDRLRSELSIR